jgi:hypothetical protein
VLANDEDPDGDTLSITLPAQGQLGSPAHGTVVGHRMNRMSQHPDSGKNRAFFAQNRFKKRLNWV